MLQMIIFGLIYLFISIKYAYRTKWLFKTELDNDFLTLYSININKQEIDSEKIQRTDIRHFNLSRSELEIVIQENVQSFYYILDKKKFKGYDNLNKLKKEFTLE